MPGVAGKSLTDFFCTRSTDFGIRAVWNVHVAIYSSVMLVTRVFQKRGWFCARKITLGKFKCLYFALHFQKLHCSGFSLLPWQKIANQTGQVSQQIKVMHREIEKRRQTHYRPTPPHHSHPTPTPPNTNPLPIPHLPHPSTHHTQHSHATESPTKHTHLQSFKQTDTRENYR